MVDVPDYEELKKVFQSVQEVNANVNKRKGANDSKKKLTEITKSARFSMSPSLSKTKSAKDHVFEEVHFNAPTWCDHCGNFYGFFFTILGDFIWGLTKQGHACKACKFAAHKKCKDKVLPYSCTSIQSLVIKDREFVGEIKCQHCSVGMENKVFNKKFRECTLFLFSDAFAIAYRVGSTFDKNTQIDFAHMVEWEVEGDRVAVAESCNFFI
jgi:hypothetical protein